nr:hypothetical protein [Tanacetum cinerariifolium]
MCKCKKGSEDWNSLEYQDTAGSKGKKVTNALSFYKMETDEATFDENLISKEYAVKLCLDYEVKKGQKLVKKELIIALKGELYFVKFIINPEEDDVEPGVILGRSFMRLAKGIVDLDGDHLTQEEAEKEALAMRISQKFALLEEEKEDPRAFIFPIKLEGKVNENALADTGSDINTMPYRIYETLGREEMKKIIKFRLGGRAHSLTLLEFAHRLGLFQATELDEEGFNIYFEGGLRSDEHFNARDYWLSISREENLSLSRSHASTIKYLVLRVIHKMITYGLYQRTTGELIDSKSRLIPKDPQPGIPRVGIPRPRRASMWDSYDRMGRMEIRQKAIEWMEMGCDGEIDDMLRIRLREARFDEEIFTYTPKWVCKCCLVDYKVDEEKKSWELIDSKSRLIPEDPQPGIPRVGIPRPRRASMWDSYDRMGRMEIRQ